MIKLERPAPPQKLVENAERWREEYQQDHKKAVWNHDEIRNALLQMSHHKCAYCECSLREASVYGEIEHILPKKYHPELVVDWENLLLACKRCNLKKSDANRDGKMLDPCRDQPREHLLVKQLWIVGTTERGKITTRILDFRDENLCDDWYRISKIIAKSLQDVLDLLQEESPQTWSERQTNNRRKKIENIFLYWSNNNTPFSAFGATIVLQHPLLEEIFEFCDRYNLWQEERANWSKSLQTRALCPF